MLVTREELRRCSRETLRVLEGRGIKTLESLSLVVDTSGGFEQVTKEAGPTREFLEVSRRPSNPLGSGSAYTLSYISQVRRPFLENNTILEGRINCGANYTLVIAKCNKFIEGYSPFARYPSGIVVWSKKIPVASFDVLREEFGKL